MRLSCLRSVLAAISLVATASSVLAANDYKALHQPKVYKSQCAKFWEELGGSVSSSSSADRSSDGGELNVNLSVKLARFTSDYVDFNTRAYNGMVPAPTIKVCPGDRLAITLTNELEEGSSNNTNLHLHGVHVPPVGDADNVMPNVEPHGQRLYVYDIRPDHPAGTFWYHPHSHGNVNSQLNGMMAGTLIVVDRPSDFPENLAVMDDLVLLLQAVCLENCHNVYDELEYSLENKFSHSTMKSHADSDEDELRVWPTDLEVVEDDADVPLNDTSLPTVYVNGQYLPSIDFNVGEYKRLRFVNAIANNVAELVTTKGSSCTLSVLAMDGIYFDNPKEKSVVVIPPGGRADVAIMCAEIGEFYLETDCSSSRNKLLGMVNQHRVPSQRIVKLKVTEDENGESTEATHLPTTLPARPAYLVDTVNNLRAGDKLSIPRSNKYDFEFSVWMDSGIQYGVNHEKLNLKHVNHSMPVNELQQWDITINDYGMSSKMDCDFNAKSSTDRRLKSNNCRTMSHPFHIHSTHFQISDMDDETDPDGVMFDLGEWRDTLPLFRAGVQIRFTPREYMVGNIFAHCHIASHVDSGMSALFSVYNSASDPAEDDDSEEGDSASDMEDLEDESDNNDKDDESEGDEDEDDEDEEEAE